MNQQQLKQAHESMILASRALVKLEGTNKENAKKLNTLLDQIKDMGERSSHLPMPKYVVRTMQKEWIVMDMFITARCYAQALHVAEDIWKYMREQIAIAAQK